MRHDFQALEQLIDRQLARHLAAAPAPRAPGTLLPRVMQAVRTGAPAVEPTGWPAWPLAWQAASVAAMVVLLLGVIQLWPVIDETLAIGWSHVAAAFAPYADAVAQTVGPFLTAGRVIWRVIVQPVGLFLLVLVAVMWAACAVFGTALGRVAFGGTHR